jgi:hypothetical protein
LTRYWRFWTSVHILWRVIKERVRVMVARRINNAVIIKRTVAVFRPCVLEAVEDMAVGVRVSVMAVAEVAEDGACRRGGMEVAVDIVGRSLMDRWIGTLAPRVSRRPRR